MFTYVLIDNFHFHFLEDCTLSLNPIGIMALHGDCSSSENVACNHSVNSGFTPVCTRINFPHNKIEMKISYFYE